MAGTIRKIARPIAQLPRNEDAALATLLHADTALS
jgi:hypothetical protein